MHKLEDTKIQVFNKTIVNNKIEKFINVSELIILNINQYLNH